jgi:hypothetical protein
MNVYVGLPSGIPFFEKRNSLLIPVFFLQKLTWHTLKILPIEIDLAESCVI